MADFTQSPQRGYAPHVHPENAISAWSMTTFANVAGAAVSLALVVGIGVWGYKLMVRDVSGIPVVRAAAGEMRVRPENPGGQQARHQGLSVNMIAAIGSSDARAEELRLAPQPVALEDEDQPMPELEQKVSADLPAAVQMTAPVKVAAAVDAGTIEDLVAQLTAGVAPLEPVEGAAAPQLASASTPQLASAQVLSGPGVRVSLRPPSQRPEPAAVRVPASAASTAGTVAEIDIASLPAGTRLVQLGAFDSPEVARAQWGQITARFGPFMEGKQRIVQQAKSGGRTFYRLRAHGFEDIADARRFCSALVAESADCIPVVTR